MRVVDASGVAARQAAPLIAYRSTIMLRHNLLRLAEDVQNGKPMTVADVLERLASILEYLPDDPPEAF